MKQVYQAEDGTVFDTEAECKAYEGDSKLRDFINEHIGGFAYIEVSDVEFLIQKHIDEIIRIVKGGAVAAVTSDDGWISNEGNDTDDFPDKISGSTIVDIKYRNGVTDRDYAREWDLSWRSTDNDPLDIVAYRIVK